MTNDQQPNGLTENLFLSLRANRVSETISRRLLRQSLCSFLAMTSFFLTGCQTLKAQPSKEKTQEAQASLSTVAGALSGRHVSEDELRNLSRQIANNPETKEAVESVVGAVRKAPVVVKYCPVDGRHFASTVKRCPEHNVLLKVVEE